MGSITTSVAKLPFTNTSAKQDDALYCAWLKAIARHDQEAFRTFYETTVDRVYGLALKITGSPQTAEDIVLDIYLQVWRKANTFNPDRGKALTWLLVMCRNRALDAIRRLPPMDTKGLNKHFDEIADLEQQPDELLSMFEREKAVYKALQQLNTTQRQVISLAFFRGLTHSEIAKYIQLPLGTVKSHIRKTLRLIEDLLEIQKK